MRSPPLQKFIPRDECVLPSLFIVRFEKIVAAVSRSDIL
jgi:hypothetical protein